MKKSEYNNIKKSCNRNKFIMFVQTLEEVLFYYSFESYKLPALILTIYAMIYYEQSRILNKKQ